MLALFRLLNEEKCHEKWTTKWTDSVDLTLHNSSEQKPEIFPSTPAHNTRHQSQRMEKCYIFFPTKRRAGEGEHEKSKAGLTLTRDFHFHLVSCQSKRRFFCIFIRSRAHMNRVSWTDEIIWFRNVDNWHRKTLEGKLRSLISDNLPLGWCSLVQWKKWKYRWDGEKLLKDNQHDCASERARKHWFSRFQFAVPSSPTSSPSASMTTWFIDVSLCSHFTSANVVLPWQITFLLSRVLLFFWLAFFLG